MRKPTSEAVATALLKKLANYAARVQEKKRISSAERRHLLRLRTVKALRDGNWEINR